MKATITVNMDGAAFDEPDGWRELRRILREAANQTASAVPALRGE